MSVGAVERTMGAEPQRVVGLIGCPGSGKTTYARRFDPLDGWVHLTLDDLRQALWPPHRQVYWQVRLRRDREAEDVLHRVKAAALEAALAQGFSVVMADTHLIPDLDEPDSSGSGPPATAGRRWSAGPHGS